VAGTSAGPFNGQKPTDIEIKGNGVLAFLFAGTGYGNTVIVTSLVVGTRL
jgi:hypothetical protein